jgi:signal peptidase I
MEPNYHNNEYLFIEKLSYRFREPKRGEVIVFKYPNNHTINYIKRIIGLPGDSLRIENGSVYVNGELTAENYLPAGTKTVLNRSPDTPYEIIIPAREFFVMGDNRSHSSDSREGWLVDENLIIGRSAATLYPVTKVSSNPITP